MATIAVATTQCSAIISLHRLQLLVLEMVAAHFSAGRCAQADLLTVLAARFRLPTTYASHFEDAAATFDLRVSREDRARWFVRPVRYSSRSNIRKSGMTASSKRTRW